MTKSKNWSITTVKFKIKKEQKKACLHWKRRLKKRKHRDKKQVKKSLRRFRKFRTKSKQNWLKNNMRK